MIRFPSRQCAIFLCAALLLQAEPQVPAFAATFVLQSRADAGTMSDSQILDTVSALHVPFIENRGQADESVSFYADTAAGRVFVTGDGLTYALRGADSPILLQEHFAGAGDLRATGTARSATQVSIFHGADAAGWKTGVATYQALTFNEVWNGISIDLQARHNSVEKIFRVAPGANPADIGMTIGGARGMHVDADGRLVLDAGTGGEYFMTAPVAWQMHDDRKSDVSVRYALRDGHRYGFTLGAYDTGKELFIDPLLAGTFFGGSADDPGITSQPPANVAVDASGNIYITGTTLSTNLPVTPGAYRTTYGPPTPPAGWASDAYIAKFSADLSQALAVTYIGGTAVKGNMRIVIGPTGDPYLTGGLTMGASGTFPTTGGAYSACSWTSNSFVARFNSSLTSLVASTCLRAIGISDIVVDVSGNAYLTGWAAAAWQMPATPGTYDDTLNDTAGDMYIAKLDGLFTTLLATYVGGTSEDSGESIDIDPAGNIVVAGTTSSANFPTTVGSHDASFNGMRDIFVVIVNNSLTSLLASTYVGGSLLEYGRQVVFDPAGNIVVAGTTASANFPTTVGAYDTTWNGGGDFVISKFNPSLALLASTFLGGAGSEGSWPHIQIGPVSGDVYIAGESTSSYPVTPGAFNPTHPGGFAAVVSRLTPNLSTLVASTYLSGAPSMGSIALDAGENVIVGGYTTSCTVPTTPGAYSNTIAGGREYFINKLNPLLSAGTEIRISCGSGSVTISGTLYQADGVTPISGKTIRFSRNGAAASATTAVTAADGSYSFSQTVSASDIITLYVDNAAEDAVTVARAELDNMTGMDLYRDTLIVRHEDAGPITNANLNTADNSGDTDITSVYTMSSNNVTLGSTPVPAYPQGNYKHLLIWQGDTYTPGGNVTVAFGNWTNRGTYVPGTYTTTFTGMNATLSGSTLFYNLRKDNQLLPVSTHTFRLNAGNTFTVGGSLVLGGRGATTVINVRSTVTGSTAILNSTSGNYNSVQYLTVRDNILQQAGAVKSPPLNPANSVDAGNTQGWFSPSTPISGTLYQADGITPISGRTIALSRNGAAALATAVTSATGAYTLNSTTASSDVLTLYVDGATEKAVTVARAGAAAVMTGMDLYRDTLILRHEDNGPITHADLNTADNSADADITAIWTGTTNVTLGANKHLLIWQGDTYLPGGNITLSGNWTNRGAYAWLGSMTTTFSGTNQTISGSTIFGSITKNHTLNDGQNEILRFESGDLFTIRLGGTLTLNGLDANDAILIRATQTGSAALFRNQGAFSTVDYVDVRDNTLQDTSIGTVKSPPLNPPNSIDSGNTQGWFSTISGTVYTDQGVTPMSAGKTVRLLRNGIVETSATTLANGSYSMQINNCNLISGDILTVFVDGMTEKAAAVSRCDSSTPGNISGFDLYQDTLIVRSDGATTTSSVNLDTGHNGDADLAALYADGGGTSLTTAADKTLLVWGNLRVNNTLDVNGSLTIRTSAIVTALGAITLAGNLSNAGTLNHTGILTFDGTSAQSLNAGSSPIGSDIVISNTTAPVMLAVNALNIGANNLTINSNATLSLNGNNLTATNTFSNNGTLQWWGTETVSLTQDIDSGTWEFTGDGDGTAELFTLRDFGATDYYNVIFRSIDPVGFSNGVGDSFGSAAAKVFAGTMQISTRGGYDAGTQSTTVTGLVTVSGGAYQQGTGTQTLNGGLYVSGGTYSINDAAGIADINGNFTMTSGSVHAPGTVQLSGTWLQTSGTFAHANGTVVLDGTDQTLSIAGNNGVFHNLTKQNTTDDAVSETLTIDGTASHDITVNGTLLIDGLDADDMVFIRSTVSGSAPQIIMNGSSVYATHDFLNVKDSIITDNSSAFSVPVNPASSVNSGNAVGWFGTPTVTGVSSLTANGSYGQGSAISIQVSFDQAVEVTGTPRLTLETGLTDAVADYTSGDGTNTLTFTYNVAAGQVTEDLEYVSANALTLNGGTIQSAGAQDASLLLPAPGAAGSLGANKAITIYDMLQFTMRLKNNGPQPATGLSVTTTVPEGTVFSGATYAGGPTTPGSPDTVCTAITDRLVRCVFDPSYILPAGNNAYAAAYALIFSMRYDSCDDPEPDGTVSATFTGGGIDPNTADNIKVFTKSPPACP